MRATHTHAHLHDARAWFVGSIEPSAVAAADRAFADLRAVTPTDLAQQFQKAGLAPLLAWADALAVAGLDREPWALEAALGAVRAYRDRLGALMAAAGEGGRT